MNDELKEGIEREGMPETPEGIGMKYQEIRSLLQDKHETTVGVNDPVLMLVTICNVFLGEIEQSHQRHESAMGKIIAGKTQEYVAGVKETTAALTTTLSDASVEGIRKTFDEQAGRLKAFETKLFWCSALVGLSALASAALYILK